MCCSGGSEKVACRRGTVIGILKALLGLSTSVYTSIYEAFLEPHQASFLLLLAIGPSIMGLILAPFINYVPFIQIEPHTKVSLFMNCLQLAMQAPI